MVRKLVREFRQIVLTPPGLPDPAFAIAASRAGELGLLDLEYVADAQAAHQAADRLARLANNPYGLKLNCRQGELLASLLAQAPEHLTCILLTRPAPDPLRQQVEIIHQKNRRVLLEATSLAEARLGEQLGVDGVIAKGHEAGGYVGEETTFVLLQQLLKHLRLPVYAQGGIGLHTAAACYAAGAAGVVLDAQLALTRETTLPARFRDLIAAMDGSETTCLGGELGECFRVYFRPGLSAVEALRREGEALVNAQLSVEEKRQAWRGTISRRVADQVVWPLGQEAALAAPLARRFVTVSGVLSAIRSAIETHVETAQRLRPLDQGAPLAQSHGTRYPIVQGPMTRVSDRPAFALEVAKAGGLPFLALALMRKAEVVSLLEETRRQLGEHPWGVGILGFVPPDVRQEQLEAIRLVHPTFALIAGGRPDQAIRLEQEGIPTYLHAPSPGLLRMFLAQGAKRFVFEGRECGGHVGPRSSFVLWETMMDVLLEHLAASREGFAPQDFHVLFAGGIHDAVSAAMVSVLAAPLAERGVRLGGLMGTAYLFTREAVASGAITPAYQAEALRSQQTVLLESGPGHATRCLPTPFTQTFAEHKRRLQQDDVTGERLREALEALNLGRLRLATKGIARHPRYGQDPAAPKYIVVDETAQREQGMYMIGQVAALRDQVCSLEDLHREVSIQGSARLAGMGMPVSTVEQASLAVEPATVAPTRIAIVGMAGLLPGAANVRAYWDNILNKTDAIVEVPADRWDWQRYFDSDRAARDKIYSRWGGFIEAVPFNPLDYGMPPNSVPSIEPLQLLMLETVRAGLADAGYLDRPFPRERTSIIVGVGGGLGDLGYLYGFRSYLPHFLEADAGSGTVISRLSERLPEWTEDSFPGILLNVVAGRIANRFDLGGPNFTVDAACASSLVALDVAIKDLETRRADMAIVGAGDTVQSPFAFLAFSKTQALSPSGRCRPFDANADGIAISEGLAVVILKRLEDAERDGDRIYAIIQGIGASSDGRDKSLTAPRPAGQLRALRRAYAQAGFPPDTVGLIEAHGTGTRVGDPAEVEALCELFQPARAERSKTLRAFRGQSCALGSVKSMIGHTKSTAGLAGLIKVALALHHRALPPTLVDQPNPKINFPETPFYVNNQARPWLTASANQARRAGVSAFGFGGTNAHVVLEEYRGHAAPPQASRQTWPAELLVWRSPDRASLVNEINQLEKWLASGDQPRLRDLAYSSYLNYQQSLEVNQPAGLCLAVVATSLDDLKQKLDRARARLMAGEANLHDPTGVYCAEAGHGNALPATGGLGKIAFLFPGQGSQYPHMLRDLALQFPQVLACFEQANHVLRDVLPRPLGDYIFPIPAYTEDEAQAHQQALTATRVAQPALGAAGLALSRLFKAFGVRPDVAAGHSYGELVALCEAGVISDRDLLILSEARGQFMAEATGPDSGTMAAIAAGREAVLTGLASIPTLQRGPGQALTLANLNSPQQTVISGPRAEVELAVQHFQSQGIRAQVLPVACAFHSPLVAPASERLEQFLKTIEFRPPALEVFSNDTGQPYPSQPEAIRGALSEHLIRPVEFQREVEAMYEAGARLFVEVGPRNVLSGLVSQILAAKAGHGDAHPDEAGHGDALPTYRVVAIDQPGSSGLTALQKALGQLAAYGVPLRLDPLYEGREVTRLNLSRPYESPERARLSPMTWLVNGGRARRWQDETGHGAGHRDALPQATTATPLQVKLADEHIRPSAPAPETTRLPAEEEAPPAHASESAAVRAGRAPITESQEAAVGHGDEAAQVILQHQRLMSRFLEVQQQIMLAYLSEPGHRDALPTQSSEEEKRPAPALHAPRSTLRASPPAPSPASPPLSDSPPKAHGEAGHRDALPTAPARDALPTAPARDALPMAQEASIVRSTLISTEAPHVADGSSRTSLPPDRVILITDDGEGVAQALADTLRSQGYRVARVVEDQNGITVGAGLALAQSADAERDVYQVDLTSPDSVARLLTAIRQAHGPIGGLLHLSPLCASREIEAMQLDDWQASLRREVIGLFHLLQGVHEDLAASARVGGACLLAATDRGGLEVTTSVVSPSAEGGDMVSESRTVRARPYNFFPGRGGLAGLLKTAAHELPEVRVKVVDVNLQHGPVLAARAILQELTAGDNLIEVGYQGLTRRTLSMALSPLVSNGASAPALSSQSVILITGGARGITAQAAEELALRYQPTLVIVGRSPAPAPEESPLTAGLASARALKEALIASLSQVEDPLQGAGRPAPLAEVEAAYQRLLREREMRASLQAMRRAGANVQYCQVDVRDERAFGALIDEVYRTHGRLDGVIHGAGIIEDKLIKDKTPASFERVVSTKADSAFILSRKLRPDSLKFLVFFSSVSGRFGNRGQSDYAAANEVLNKLALYLDQRWPARVVSINWGPWDGAGMVSPEVRQEFKRRGVSLIPATLGRQKLIEELNLGRKGEVEVMICGEDAHAMNKP